MISLEGIIPPLPTSFHENEELYPEMIRGNAEYLIKKGLTGILVLGSNGEMVMLSDSEKEWVYATAREAIPSDRLLIAGTGGQSTRETIRLTKLAARQEADAALVLNPFYYKRQMTPGVLVQYYNDVADASEIPVIIYNMPANSGLDMNSDTILKIAEHPNIIGVKDSSGNIVKMGEVIQDAPPGFQVLAGSAGFFLPSLVIGAVGGIMALANLLPEKCLRILNDFYDGDMDTARKLQNDIVPLNTAVTRQWGVPALKAAMDHVGLYGGPVRRPLLSLDESRKAKLVKMIMELE
jgi:4-hydroxy-2-oxoglutarate aldolase